MRPRRARRGEDSDEECRFDASTSLREPDPVPFRPPICIRASLPGGPRRLILRDWFSQVPVWDVMDMTVADCDPNDSEKPHNCMSDPVENVFQQPCRRKTTRVVHSLRRCDDVVHPTRLDGLERDLRPTSANLSHFGKRDHDGHSTRCEWSFTSGGAGSSEERQAFEDFGHTTNNRGPRFFQQIQSFGK